MPMRYYQCCVCWPSEDVHVDGGLCDMISAGHGISRRTFLQHVDREDMRELEHELGYERDTRRGLTMANDYHVSYHRSTLHGERVYYFTHSAIEYVFTEPKREEA